MKILRFFLVVLLAGAASVRSASWNEAVNGDLSNDWLNPTALSIDAGVNSITATSVGEDREYVTFSIPAGFQLASITLNIFGPTSGVSFIGIESGTQFTDPATTAPGDLLGYAHFGSSHLGTDVLDDMSTGFGAIGFTPPLPEGNYTLWIQEVGPTARTYSFGMNVVAVPEPASILLFVSGLCGIGGVLWRARRR